MYFSSIVKQALLLMLMLFESDPETNQY